MPYEVPTKGGFLISDDHGRLDIPMVCAFITNESYWARGRPSDLMVRAIAASTCFGIYTPDRRQVGFARVISDFALRAHLNDVFILSAFRGKGLGKALVAAVLDHPKLRDVGTWTLATRDAHALYAAFGFRPALCPEDQMTLTHADD